MSQEIFGALVADMDDELAHLVKEELQRGWHVQKVMSAMETARLRAANDRIEHCTVEGLGQHVMDVPTDAYFAWKHHLGDNCWADKDFQRWFKKQNPETVVPYTPRATTVLVP